MIVGDQGMPPAKYTPPDEIAVPGQEPSVFGEDARGQLIVGNEFLIGRIVAEHPEPARKAPEHRVGEKGPSEAVVVASAVGVIGLVGRSFLRHAPLYPGRSEIP